MGFSRTTPLPLQECKIRASLLLKGLRSPDPQRAAQAAERFCALPAFAGRSPGQVLAEREGIRLKHALAVVAREQGHPSWAELKHAAEEAEPRFDAEAFFAKGQGAFLNRWFATYPEALASLRAEGGFLFPFREQFFICEAGFLEIRQIDVADPDWERIGRNWVEPGARDAQERLERKLIALGFKG